jgi:hypothetical protein
MDVDPMEAIDMDDEKEKEEKQQEKARHRLNSLVAITVAILATFMGICKVKDDNIVQAMQQAQANKIDNWSFYQARNIREELARATADQLELQAATAPASARAGYQAKITEYRTLQEDQNKKKTQVKADAEQADKDYNNWNIHDDQFDLSDALLAISISLLALTALTQKRWLFGIAMVPTFFGVLMGMAGLFGWALHSDLLAKWLGT